MSESIHFKSDIIRRFLLGRLAASEREVFERRFLTGDDLHERVRAAEIELADDFVRGRMNRFDRQRFAKTFVVTEARRRTVAVSNALNNRFSSSRTKVKPAVSSWADVFAISRPVWRVAFGALVLLLLIGSVWLVTKEPNLVRRIIPKRVPAKPAAIATPVEANHPSDTAPPLHQETSSPPAHESSLPTTPTESAIVTTAVPSTDASQAPIITLPEGMMGKVRLELAMERNETGEFKAELLMTNQTVLVMDAVKVGSNGQLDVDVPVQLIKAGDYEIRLTSLQNTPNQIVASYYFRVR